MQKDYYKTLGVDKNASKEDIKKAFRKLAHLYHPDKKGGDEAKFKEINEAYSVLSDDKKRAQYDSFGSGFSGGNGASGGWDFQGQGFGAGQWDFSQFSGAQGGFEGFDLNDILGSIFGGGSRRVRRGRDVSIDVDISFKDSIFGLDRKVSINSKLVKQKEINIHIPAGIENGQMIRLSQFGEVVDGGVPGDLYVKIHVEKHPFFRKEGFNLLMDLSIKLSEALLGGERDVETLDGKIKLKIPVGVSQGEVLRVKGKGISMGGNHRGDILIRIKIEMPKKLSKNSRNLIEKLKEEGI